LDFAEKFPFFVVFGAGSGDNSKDITGGNLPALLRLKDE
jgi:hypothetical protein